MNHLAEDTRIDSLSCLMRVPNHAQKTSGGKRFEPNSVSDATENTSDTSGHSGGTQSGTLSSDRGS